MDVLLCSFLQSNGFVKWLEEGTANSSVQNDLELLALKKWSYEIVTGDSDVAWSALLSSGLRIILLFRALWSTFFLVFVRVRALGSAMSSLPVLLVIMLAACSMQMDMLFAEMQAASTEQRRAMICFNYHINVWLVVFHYLYKHLFSSRLKLTSCG